MSEDSAAKAANAANAATRAAQFAVIAYAIGITPFAAAMIYGGLQFGQWVTSDYAGLVLPPVVWLIAAGNYAGKNPANTLLGIIALVFGVAIIMAGKLVGGLYYGIDAWLASAGAVVAATGYGAWLGWMRRRAR